MYVLSTRLLLGSKCLGKIEAFLPMKLKQTTQNLYAHARNLRLKSDNNYFINIEFLTL